MLTSLIISLLLTRLDARSEMKSSLLPGKSVINIIPGLFGYSSPPKPKDANPGLPGQALPGSEFPRSMLQGLTVTEDYLSTLPVIDFLDATDDPPPMTPFLEHPVQHAGLPRSLAAYPFPLQDAYHELKFNVSWEPPIGPPARDYSIEVRSVTNTVDCQTPMCYEYNIPGTASWWEVPANPAPVAETCAIRPGCAYSVRLVAHPWDGHTSANLLVELDECVAGVCSCAHSPRLPAPLLSAKTVSIQGELFVNVTWVTPKPQFPQRLPPGLKKQQYAVSIGKQMVSDAHPAPWFANTITRYVPAEGLVVDADNPRWLLVPVSERSDDERSGKERSKTHQLVLDVRLLARVNVIDDRGCVGPAGNVTAYDPVEASRISIGTYILWAVFGGACVLVMGALLAMGTRLVKKVLNAFRPAPVSAPLTPLRRRPAWFQLPLRSNTEIPVRGQMEDSPLYVHKEFEPPEEDFDEWEVSRSRVHLGALIGSGAFGRVHAAQLVMPAGETLTVAAKMLAETASADEMNDFLREIVMLKHVGYHKNVIRLVACCTKRAPLIALLEHAPRGDLLSLLRAARGRREVKSDSGMGRPSEGDSEYTNLSDSDPALSDEKSWQEERSQDHYVAEPALRLDGWTMREYTVQIASGMRHLEERAITHRDLAARNILVDGAGVLKVADFGLSRTGIYVHTKAKPVPLRWLAPESIVNSQYSSASDVWAFGVLLWEIATLGGFPYSELSNQHVPSFLAGGGRLPKPVRASTRLYHLMVECWSERPEDRPTFAQIVDKLNAQKKLYVDLDTVFPPTDDVSGDADDFHVNGF